MLKLNEWQVSPDTCTLSRNAPGNELESIRLSPRAMDVLVYLCRRPGEVVSGEELLDTFWVKASASDHAVHKIIASLRSALGDSASKPRFIKTLPKRGYALIGEVSDLQSKGDEAEAGPSQNPNHRSTVPGSFQDSRAVRVPPLRINGPALGLLLLLFGGIAVAWALFTFSAGNTVLATTDNNRARLAILVPLGGPSEQSRPYQIEALLDSLSVNLSRMPGLDVIAVDAGIDSLDAARQLGAGHALTSNIYEAGDGMRLTLSLIRVEDGVSLYANRFSLQDNAFLAIENEIIPTVLDSLSIVLDEGRYDEMLAWGTRNTRAYNYFLKAGFYNDQYNHQDWELALNYYDRAINEDPMFINAYLGKATAANNMAVYSRNDRVEHLSKEVLELSRQLALVAPGSMALDTLNSVRMRIEGRNEHRQEMYYREQIREGRAPGYLYARYALFLIGARLYEEADEFLTLAGQSASHQVTPNEAWNFRTQTLPPAELAEVKVSQLTEHPVHIGILGTAISSLAWIGEFDKAESYLQRQIGRDGDGVRAHLSRVIVAVLKGDVYHDVDGELSATAAYQDLLSAETLHDADLAFNNGVLYLMMDDFAAAAPYWRNLTRIDRRKLFTRLHAIEHMFPRSVLEGEAYAALLEELGAGRSWQQQLIDGVAALSEYTGVYPDPATLARMSENELVLRPAEPPY